MARKNSTRIVLHIDTRSRTMPASPEFIEQMNGLKRSSACERQEHAKSKANRRKGQRARQDRHAIRDSRGW